MLLRAAAVGIAVAASVFALLYANGGFNPTTRAYAGIAAWWLLGVGAAFGIASARSGVDRLALAAIGLLAAFDIWILISIRWAADAERAFAQFNQVALYVAVLAIAIVLGRLVSAPVLVGAVAAALSVLAGVALVSRFFPSTFGLQPGSTILPTLKNRLSFPLGYWNGLGIAVALGYPLLLSIMISRRSRIASALAAFPLPLLAAVMYLTSSRGAFVAAGVAVVIFVVLTPRRWPAVAAVGVAVAAGALAVAILVPKKSLVNGDVDTALGVQQGHHAALWIGVTCVVTALVWAGLMEAGKKLSTPSRRVGQVAVVVLVVLAVVAIALAHPIAKFDEFKNPCATQPAPSGCPTAGTPTQGTTTTSHLLNTSGSGRWQFWSAAISQFRAHPLNGGGAGSWEAWWLQHGSLHLPSEFAHSLYLEALGELGIIGLLLIAGAVIVAAVGAVRSALALRSGEIAAAAACGIAFFVAAAYDWVWQLSGIAVVAVGMLGVALGALPAAPRATAWGGWSVLRPALALVAVAAIIPQYVVLASGNHLSNSQAAYRAGDGSRARSEALAAKAIEPWAASPYLQLAFVAEAQHRYGEAVQWADEAIRRSRNDWTLWAAKAAFEAATGNVPAARQALAEARRLNPRSSVLAAPTPGGG